jgi:hypothetical protein
VQQLSSQAPQFVIPGPPGAQLGGVAPASAWRHAPESKLASREGSGIEVALLSVADVTLPRLELEPVDEPASRDTLGLFVVSLRLEALELGQLVRLRLDVVAATLEVAASETEVWPARSGGIVGSGASQARQVVTIDARSAAGQPMRVMRRVLQRTGWRFEAHGGVSERRRDGGGPRAW